MEVEGACKERDMLDMDMDVSGKVVLEASQAVVRAVRKEKRERNELSGKSSIDSDAPCLVGYEDSSRFLGDGDGPSSKYTSCHGCMPSEIEGEIQTTRSANEERDNEDNNMIVDDDKDRGIERHVIGLGASDRKAEARAKRQAKRDLNARLGKSSEAPRIVYEDESSRIFCDDNVGDAQSIWDGNVLEVNQEKQCSASPSPSGSTEPFTAGNEPSTEGTCRALATFEQNSATFYMTGNENGPLKPSSPEDDSKKAGIDEKKYEFCNASMPNSLYDERQAVGGIDKAAASDNKSLSMSLPKRKDPPSCKTEAKLYHKDHVRGHGTSDLSLVSDQPPSIREVSLSRNDSAHSEESTNVSLQMEDLRPSLDSYQCASEKSFVSDISIGFEELNEEASIESRKRHTRSDTVLSSVMQVPRKINSTQEGKTALHSSLMIPKSSRHENDLRRSLSENPGVRLNLSQKLEDEIKKGNAARRLKRARVARKNDGKLDASMTGSVRLGPAPGGRARRLAGALISSDKSGKRKSDAAETNTTGKRSFTSTSSDMGGYNNNAKHNMAGRAKTIDVPLIDSYESSLGSSAEMVSDEKRLQLHSIQVSRNEPARCNTGKSNNVSIPKPEMVSNEKRIQVSRRYRRRMASSIKMMQNQFFIPPREEGGSFIESLYYTMNGYSNDFVVWIYEASFYTVLFLFFFFSYGLILTFALILVWMESRTGGRCGLDLYESWKNSHPHYELAFELSWTTFTTVGYGLVSPSDDVDCYPIRLACSLFAFMGLLFNSLSAAIFFSKLEHVLTRASVTFSSSVSLQFGKAAGTTRGSKGVYGQFWMKNSSMRSLLSIGTGASRSNKSITSEDSGRRLPLIEEVARPSLKVPYPFLEFRIVNDHANYQNRSVRNANVTAMVQLSAVDADDKRRSKRRLSSGGTFREYVSVSSSKISREHAMRFAKEFEGLSPMAKPPLKRERSLGSSSPADQQSTEVVVQELDFEAEKPGGLEGRVYFPLDLEPSSHPHFKRVWYCRHILNAKSPLLTQSVREKIERNGGWNPQHWRYKDILGTLVHFHRIRITFKGTSAVSNALVFAQKVYTLEDVYVGWQFGQIFYQKESWKWLRFLKPLKHEDKNGICDDENLILDKRLIHDIIPQDGGGQEPIEG